MPDEFPMNDPKRIWQNQPTESFTMSLAEIRRKAQRLQTKARLATLARIVIGLVLCVAFARASIRMQDMVPRFGYGVLSLWSLYGAWQSYKWIWPRKLAADAALGTSLDFYRGELERQRDYGRHIWRRAGLTFCFVGVALVILPGLIKALDTPRLLLNAVPFFALLITWFVLFFTMRKRNQQKLQREIDELNPR